MEGYSSLEFNFIGFGGPDFGYYGGGTATGGRALFAAL
jgi:hypothetical protein